MSEMGTSGEVKVPYAITNIERCMCPQCPVQADSVCTLDKIGNLKNEMKSLGKDEVPEPHKVPGIYCSSGTATCSDLDPNKDCICKTIIGCKTNEGKSFCSICQKRKYNGM